jgi:hypothetical protein
MTFIQFLASEAGQTLISTFGLDSYGMNLFNPAVELLKTASDPEPAMWIEEAAFIRGTECPPEYRDGDFGLYG